MSAPCWVKRALRLKLEKELVCYWLYIDLSAQHLLKHFDEDEYHSKFGYVGVKKTADFSFDKQQFNIVIYG